MKNNKVKEAAKKTGKAVKKAAITTASVITLPVRIPIAMIVVAKYWG